MCGGLAPPADEAGNVAGQPDLRRVHKAEMQLHSLDSRHEGWRGPNKAKADLDAMAEV